MNTNIYAGRFQVFMHIIQIQKQRNPSREGFLSRVELYSAGIADDVLPNDIHATIQAQRFCLRYETCWLV